MKSWSKAIYFLAVFVLAYFVPWEHEVVRRSGLEAFLMLQEYVRHHVLTCLVPAFFIAGAIHVFVSQASVLKYFGAQAPRFLSYAVASVSGSILAVCSCTVLPLFAGIYMRGAGIGPATAFLYSGPAINILAIVWTAKVLGWKLGLARAIGAVVFSCLTGLLMSFFYRREEEERCNGPLYMPDELGEGRTLMQNAFYFFVMVLILIVAAFAPSPEDVTGITAFIYKFKWAIVSLLLILLFLLLKYWFKREELQMWLQSTWGFMQQILPLLFFGVLLAGFFLGRPGHSALIPESAVTSLVGGNSIWANLFASLVGALMYFATLTEVPILQGLLGSGMGEGPALALLLSGPAVSLPSILTLSGIMGWKKTLTYVAIVVILSTTSGFIFGAYIA